ncbi:MAG: hydrogenase expression/formation protein HypE [Ilumatobacter sp.]|nr:hydrogenase expression/formation protein HypE [Ilumatobacter sp.]
MASHEDLIARDAVLARVEAWRKRAPKLTDDVITMAHGAGGKASQALLEAVIRPAFSNPILDRLDDGAAFDVPTGHRVVMSTDAFVVTPRRFPGGSIGDLAVNGTINDVAAMGASPHALAVSFVLEEGLSIAEFRDIVADVAAAAATAGVVIATGDTKVVERGAADGCYITTTGIGFQRTDRSIDAARVRAGDALVVSGTIGDHGIAVMVARGNLALASDVPSDSAPLHELVGSLLDAVPETRWLRDPTRGGVASSCNELAVAAGKGVLLLEDRLPVLRPVTGACELLGLDPLYIANEGKMLAVVPAERAADAVAAMRTAEHGADACVIGAITDEHPGMVVIETAFGGSRIVDMLVGDPLPRIC